MKMDQEVKQIVFNLQDILDRIKRGKTPLMDEVDKGHTEVDKLMNLTPLINPNVKETA